MSKSTEPKKVKNKCSCPYCAEELIESSLICKACHVTIVYCPKCKTPVPKDTKICPSCKTKVGH